MAAPEDFHINDGGDWKIVKRFHINDGGDWKDVQEGWVNDGGVWKEFFRFLQVSPVANGRTNTRAGPCSVGLEFNSNGVENEANNNGGFNQSQGNWLDQGLNSEVWAARTLVSGTFNITDPTGRVRLNTTRQWLSRQTAHTGVPKNTVARWTFYNASSGGDVIFTTSNSTWSAMNTLDPCPGCCLTPDTPITMANGSLMPIGKVQKGDMILVWNLETCKQEEQEVTGLIIRTNRTMYRIHFEDGRILEISDEHPFFVKGKGPASLDHHGHEYKNLGLPRKLMLGDMVTDQNGMYQEIVKIELIDYPGPVSTFENSLFYASALVVY